MDFKHNGIKVSIADDLITELKNLRDDDAVEIVKKVLDEQIEIEKFGPTGELEKFGPTGELENFGIVPLQEEEND